MKGNSNKKIRAERTTKGMSNAVEKEKKKTITLKVRLGIIFSLLVVASFIIGMVALNLNKTRNSLDPEIARSMTYEEVQEGDDAIEGTDDVKFDAFFLRDLNSDGYAESIRGTCREVGQDDTLYMELRVLAGGYLENGVITINGNNFYLQTSIPKDEEIKENAVGNNIKKIELNTINSGTQKLLTGIVRSGNYSSNSQKLSALDRNINNYSSVNDITLTGTYVSNDGETRVNINKKVEFNVDWHGTLEAEMPSYIANKSNTSQEQDIATAKNEEDETFTVEMTVGMQEAKNQLELGKAYIEGEIPTLSSYTPTSVEITGENITYTYDEETRKFTAQKEAVVDEEGKITQSAYDAYYSSDRYNRFKIKVVYPIQAYEEIGSDTVEYKLTVSGYYEGYNNANEEFTNPYKSNTVTATFISSIQNPKGTVARFDVYVGKYVGSPKYRYIVSKEKPYRIYNGISSEETEDTYLVRWEASTGSDGNSTGLLMKETEIGGEQVVDTFIKADGSTEGMENIVTNVGIYFSSPVSLLGEEGWIKVYDDETDELIETFTNENWNNYSSTNPYKYETPVKHIRIETSATNADTGINVYNLKRLDDEYIVANYTEEEFENISYIKSTLNGYLGQSHINEDTHQAYYEVPYSMATIGINKTSISTQETENSMELKIYANANTSSNQKEWLNGAFLLKMPEGILDVQINNVTINNDNVQITSYEQYEENGINYIKINTSNETATTYTITINCNITPDPRISTKTEQIELYAYNENTIDYHTKTEDIYDINGNLNTDEMVGIDRESISLISPNSLLTSQIATNYGDGDNITIAPKILELPKEQRTADININITNNYTNAISEITILGRVPYEGNKYIINGTDMGSTFTTTMSNTGIQIPEELKNYTVVYYSENGEATQEIDNEENGWKKAEEVSDWNLIKSYIIVLENYELPKNNTHTFTYTINVPEGLNYNEVSYSHHAVYFSLNTEQGKYRTEIEPNKLGFMIAKQYDLEITKYQIGKDKVVAGATYLVREDEVEEGRTKVTGEDGKLLLEGLYVDRTYIIKETKSPTEYELNTNEVKFITKEENGELKVELIDGTVKNIEGIQPQDEQDYRVAVEVEDEVRARINITKVEEGTETPISGVRYRVSGKNYEAGKIISTDREGKTTLEGLSIGEEYTLEEVRAEGYYLANPIKFTVVNNNGTYELNILEGDTKEQSITLDNEIPVIKLKVEDEKIPTYNLVIKKVIKDTTTPLAGARFKLIKSSAEVGTYTTDEAGQLTIKNLYQYEAEKDIDQTYMLREVGTPEGYAAIKDITFKVENVEGVLTMEVTSGTIKEQSADGDTLTVTIENSPSFKLVKKDGETGEVLPNTKFAIYKVENGTEEIALDSKNNILGEKEIIDGKEYYTLTTNEKGEITANLRDGLYKAVEIKASDDKYDITDNEYYFGIGVDRVGQDGLSITGINQIENIDDSSESHIDTISATSDGGWVATGRFYGNIKIGDKEYTSENKNYNEIVIKHDKNGEIQWSKIIEGVLNETTSAYGDIEFADSYGTSDGGIVIVGRFSYDISIENTIISSGSDGSYSTDGIVIKYDQYGNLKWYTSIGGHLSKQIASVTETSDGKIVIGGTSYDQVVNIGEYEIRNPYAEYGSGYGILAKLDTNTGVAEWGTYVGSTDDSEILSVSKTNEGGIIASGYFKGNEIKIGDITLSNTSTSNEGMMIEYDKNGNVIWAESIGGMSNQTIYSYKQMNNGEYIALLYSDDNQDGVIYIGDETFEVESDIQIIAFDKEKNVKYIKELDGYESEGMIKKENAIEVTEDNGYIVGGYMGFSVYNNEGENRFIKRYYAPMYLYTVSETIDGKYIVGGLGAAGYSVGDYYIENTGGIIIQAEEVELNTSETVVEKKILENNTSDMENSIVKIEKASDNGYIALVLNTEEKSMQIDNYYFENASSVLVKFNSNNEIEWATEYNLLVDESTIALGNTITETIDGGFVAIGHFNRKYKNWRL